LVGVCWQLEFGVEVLELCLEGCWGEGVFKRECSEVALEYFVFVFALGVLVLGLVVIFCIQLSSGMFIM